MKFKKFWTAYKHIVPLLAYMVFHMIWFLYLERYLVMENPAHTVHMEIDDKIPFIEAFIIPYALWFLYFPFAFFYFFLTDKESFTKLAWYMCSGMFIFLVVSTVWPNGHGLRPDLTALGRENLFTRLTAFLYRSDTPTNIVPSLHVFNSLAVQVAVMDSRKLRKYPLVQIISLILCIVIAGSTVFVKQHSLFDVWTALLMAAILYPAVYVMDWRRIIRCREAVE